MQWSGGEERKPIFNFKLNLLFLNICALVLMPFNFFFFLNVSKLTTKVSILMKTSEVLCLFLKDLFELSLCFRRGQIVLVEWKIVPLVNLLIY